VDSRLRHPLVAATVEKDRRIEPRRGRTARLVNQILVGTQTGDRVQLHGAIVATLELYSIPDATHLVLCPALVRLTDTPPGAEDTRAAVCAHVAAYTAME
jgi:hypothetical protein